MTFAAYIVAVLGVGLLLVVHETGHYGAARWFGLRVERFSIGFGPTLVARRGRDGTTYQIGLLPFLAYVQVHGMNPYEGSDPRDRRSYANASLWARSWVLAGGALANYLFASMLVFAGLLLDGKGLADAARLGVVVPFLFVRENLTALGAWLGGHTHIEVSGPVGLVKTAAAQAKLGPGTLLRFLGLVSASMGAFNLLPFPFLDGGRLFFLGVEAVSRRKANAKLELWVHAGGLVALMLLMVFATYGDVRTQ